MVLARIYESQAHGWACLARRGCSLPAAVRCGEPMRLIAFVTDSGSITRILAYLGEPTQAPGRPRAPSRRTSIRAKADTFAESERAASESQGQGLALLGARRTQHQDVAGQSRDGCFTPLPEYEFDQRVELVGAVPLQTILPAKVT
jgi:hypothetical protein